MSVHHYCACPWCQGPKPHPRKVSDSEIEQLRKDYEAFVQRMTAPDTHRRPDAVRPTL